MLEREIPTINENVELFIASFPNTLIIPDFERGEAFQKQVGALGEPHVRVWLYPLEPLQAYTDSLWEKSVCPGTKARNWPAP